LYYRILSCELSRTHIVLLSQRIRVGSYGRSLRRSASRERCLVSNAFLHYNVAWGMVP
jgi:hypothetical protein